VANGSRLNAGAATRPAGRRHQAFWLAAYAVATFLSFPQLVAGHLIDLGLAVSWLAPLCLLLALRGEAVGRTALCAFLASWVAYAGIHHWIYVTTVEYGPLPPLLGALAPFGVALFSGVIGGAFGLAWALIRRARLANAFTFALLWAVCDHARSFLLGGFPWALIGYAQHQNRVLLPIVQIGGVYALSFVVALGGAALAGLLAALRAGRPVRRLDAAAFAVVALLHLAAGLGGVWQGDEPPGDSIRIAAIQGNLDMSEKWSEVGTLRALDAHLSLSHAAAAAGAQLIVWPETAVPGALELDRVAIAALDAFARSTETIVVVGSVGAEVDHTAQAITGWYDSAFWIDGSGRPLERYDKTKLVPFGEYMPLRALFGLFLDPLARGVAPVDVTPGRGPYAVDLPRSAGAASTRVGVPICYELLFPDVVRRFVFDGAAVLLAITNDSWYGRTGAPHQFLAMTAVRAAETGVWIVRAANSGVSAIIDATGRVRQRTGLFEPGYIVGDVPLMGTGEAAGAPTFYARHGDVFAHACWGSLITVAAWATIRARWCRRKSLGETARGSAGLDRARPQSESGGDQDHV
jgi:apolipoprotein N-acyltransferase